MTERIRLILSCCLLVIFVISAVPVDSKVFFLEADFYQDKTQERKIVLGKGEIISSDKVVSRVAVSDPEIADLQILNEKQIFARAKKLGICTLLVWEKENSKPSRFDVAVWPDIQYLTKQLQVLDPNITVEYIPPSSALSQESATSGGSQSQGGQGESTGSSSSPLGAALPGASSSSSSSSSSQAPSGKIILSGEVANAEIIARALQIAGAYVGDQGIKIISQPGGQVVDGLAGKYDIYSNSDSQSAQAAQGSATAFGARDPIRFTSNRYANLSRAVIATTQHGAVVSFLIVKDPPQISVAIRFYEIQRNVARNLGFNATFGGSTLQGGVFVGGNGVSQIASSISSLANVSMFMLGGQGIPDVDLAPGNLSGSFFSHSLGQGATGVIFNPNNGIGAVIQALQERGEIKTLAEPTLVIANGEPASFLAGGEVPILRSVFTAGGASTDVTYEPFGIKFSLLPTVTSKDRIFLQLIPEIRDIDTDLSNQIAPPGSTAVRPPVFKTRRTQTQVELESGQAFAISGLLREDNTRNLRKVPGIGDIPILGTLFRSKSFRKGETELLIVVSPQIIRPTKPENIAKLSKPEIPYHDFDQFPPLKPDIKLDDEKGPEMKNPLDATKYNEPQGYNQIENQINFNQTNQKDSSNKIAISQVTNKPVTNKSNRHFFSGKFENLKRKKNLTQGELIQKEQILKQEWQTELTRYAQAKEAMKFARENKF